MEFKILPKGKYNINEIMIDFNIKFFKELLKNSNVKNMFLDKDYDCKESLGKIEKIFIKEDGLYAKIKLNKNGEKELKKYKAIRPKFDNRKILNLSLINKPIC